MRYSHNPPRDVRDTEAMSSAHAQPAIILGAGLSGVVAARQLATSGRRGTVIDKGRGVGGRLATRRLEGAVLDHGAQFFTARSDAFARFVDQAITAGVVTEWCRGFGETDGYPRYRGTNGMTSLAKWLARDLDIQLAVQARAIACDGETVRFIADDGSTICAGRDAVVTAPIPQMLALFDAGEIELPDRLDADLRAVRYHPTLALLAVIDGDGAVDEPGGMQLDDGPFTFIADNMKKGISHRRALTFHANHAFSARSFDDDPDQVQAELLAFAAPWIGESTVVTSQLKKWRYAGPVSPLSEPTEYIDIGACRIALAGDAFAGPKVEGAFTSGLAAARALLRT